MRSLGTEFLLLITLLVLLGSSIVGRSKRSKSLSLSPSAPSAMRRTHAEVSPTPTSHASVGRMKKMRMIRQHAECLPWNLCAFRRSMKRRSTSSRSVPSLP